MYRLVKYQLEKNDNVVVLETVWIRIDIGIDEGFIEFINLSDYPHGSTKYIVLEALSGGFRLIGVDSGNNKVVLAEAEDGQYFYGRENTLRYLGCKFIKST